MKPCLEEYKPSLTLFLKGATVLLNVNLYMNLAAFLLSKSITPQMYFDQIRDGPLCIVNWAFCHDFK